MTKNIIRIFKEICFPPSAPVFERENQVNKLWWAAVCLISIIPLTAILHHALFYKPTCMLNPFGEDYYPSVMIQWLSKDPSLPWAISIMMVLWYIGQTIDWIRILVSPFFISFLPLSIWIFDIPFTGRWICHNFHDGRLLLANGVPVRTLYIYIACTLLYLLFIAGILKKKKVGLNRKERINDHSRS